MQTRFSFLFFLIIFFALSLLFILHYCIVGQATYGDGRYYYSYVRSFVVDHDLNFHNDLGHKYSASNNNTLNEEAPDNILERTPTGLIPNKYPIGTPLLWSILFIPVHFVATGINTIFPSFPNNGFSDIYQIPLGMVNVLFVVVGIYLLYIQNKRYFSQIALLLGLATLVFGTNLLFYGSIDVLNSHPSSFLVSTLFISYFFLSQKNRTRKRYFILGVILGVAALIRTQDVSLGILLAFEMIEKIDLKKIASNISNIFLDTVSFFIGFLIAFIPQIIVWKILYGTFYKSPYISETEGFNFLNPHVMELFLNPKTGLIIWTPGILLALAGLVLLLRYKRSIGIYALPFVIVQIYIISSWSGWSQGESFGIRMLISSFPFVAIGFMMFFEKVNQKFGKIPAASLCFIICLLNLFAIVYFLTVAQNPTFHNGIQTQPNLFNDAIVLINTILR